MKEQTQNSSSSQFLKTDRGKTKSNAIEIPSISLPKGGGAIKGIDEKFSVNAVNGTASFSIPLPLSPARGASPSLSLSYNSGSGNGIFGLGWNLSLGSIKRKTDKGLPQYLDSINSDTFLFSEAEDLVPEFKKNPDGSFSINSNGDYEINERDFPSTPDKTHSIRFYRPRIEGLFARIERWTEEATGRIKWLIITRENTTTLFGWTDNAIIKNPNDPTKIYEWLPEFVFDDKGNCSHFIYKKENKIGFDESLLHNRNRLSGVNLTYTNLYIDKVLYGNKTPYRQFGDSFPVETDYMFQTVFDYGSLLINDSFETINNWDYRPDAFSDYKAGFEIRTTRLCMRVLLFHVFEELALRPDKSDKKTLIKSVNFEYDTSSEQDFTYLTKITSFGYIKKPNGTYSHKKLPPMEFEYQKHEWSNEVKTISPDALIHSPAGLDEQLYQFTDLFNEGLSGILTEQANGWYYKHNLGDGKFEPAKLVSPKPSFTGLGGQLQLADLDADGGKQLVSFSAEPRGYFEMNDDNEWHGLRFFKALPNIDFGDPNTRMLDLNGDGKSEVVISEENVFTWYASGGRDGYSIARKTTKPFDEESGPQIIFADPKQSIYLADMSGDGMTDILRIRNGEVCYWPNLGYGKFGAKVSLDNAPFFDHPDSFNPSYLRLADIDGSGTSDIIYLGKKKFSCWKNLSGNRFSTDPFEIDAFPDIHSQSKITVTDLLGNGVACIVWSGTLSKDSGSPLRYIDLMHSKKPHIMVSYKNNLGKEVSMEYTPSTKFYIEDKLTGKPWVTKLHFPVHCLSKTETVDKITGWKFVSSYKYHHGYYDHPEREFRGFGMVEQTDSEHFEHWIKGDATNIVEANLHQEPVISKTWSHTGAFLNGDSILNQFAKEYWYEEMNRQGFTVIHNEIPLRDAHVIPGPGITDTAINHLSADEWREALRTCKSMALRSEVFAHDAPLTGATNEEIKRQLTPFSVNTHNCVVELLQPRGKNKHAVFIVKESEAISYNYERNVEDPRVSHNLNIKLDEYGNVLESASVVYPRVRMDDSLPLETQQAQSKTTIMYSQNRFTNDVIGNDSYRLRLASEIKTFELKGIPKSGSLYTIDDFENILSTANEVAYHQVDADPSSGSAQKRLIEHVCTHYYHNNLTGPLGPHQLESLAIPFENYQLAYTPELIRNIYEEKVNEDLLTEGKFIHCNDDANWWVRSGITHFKNEGETATDAQNRFYVPIFYTDPFGSTTRVKYYGHYFLFVEETEDELKNKSGVDVFNFRTLTPQRLRDINNNLSEAISDEHGMVKAMSVYGKGNEADDLTGLTEFTDSAEKDLIDEFFNVGEITEGVSDSIMLIQKAKQLLQHASARFVYDFDTMPAVVASIVREEHFQKNNNSPVHLSFEYSSGIGKVVMKKVQAEPGLAKKVIVTDDNNYSITELNTARDLSSRQLRWTGNGRTILNNKGNPVKQYEPYFSASHKYEDFKELVEQGVTPIMYYDAAGRLIKTKMPDATYSKVEFDSWKQVIYDANDTILDSPWYQDRFFRRIDAVLSAEDKDPIKEQLAASKAARHANTPVVLHFDTLGRPVLSIDHNKNITTETDEYYRTKVKLDAEGNLRNVTDAREIPENMHKGNTVMQYKYDMLGNKVYHNSMDGGQRWLFINVLGNPLRTWDERRHEFQYFYDTLHRPSHSIIKDGDGVLLLNHIFDKIIYGESLLDDRRINEDEIKSKNLLGKTFRHYDIGGLIQTPEYDFKGQPVSTSRQLFNKYKEVPHWVTDDPLQDDLEGEAFTFITATDALGRITRQVAPDRSVIIPAYNEAGLLNEEKVEHDSPAVTSIYIEDIDYNEKGQRNKIIFGNDVITKYYYDKETFRLKRLESLRRNGDVLQDLFYTYDPVGNISAIEDKAIPISFFANTRIEPVSEYSYDALYRLVEATGRENNAALAFDVNDNWNDGAFMHSVNPGDPMSVRDYKQRFQYDEAGNITEMRHQAAGNNWTRNFLYEHTNNRLRSTRIGSQTYHYPHHAEHGFINIMPHLDEMGWNFKEELVKTIKQRVNPYNGTAETTYYQYDGQGQRIRKITENSASSVGIPTKKNERIYIAGYETYRTYQTNLINFERESLSLMDGGHRFVMIETVKQNTDTSPDSSDSVGVRLTRYHLHNHLGSASLELDATAQIISYEEYHPYGTTAYQLKNAAINATSKRYRYTGMERDEETGLEYHSARYYLPWLGRWASADPVGIKDGVNVYRYAKNNPILFVDHLGNQGTLPPGNNIPRQNIYSCLPPECNPIPGPTSSPLEAYYGVSSEELHFTEGPPPPPQLDAVPYRDPVAAARERDFESAGRIHISGIVPDHSRERNETAQRVRSDMSNLTSSPISGVGLLWSDPQTRSGVISLTGQAFTLVGFRAQASSARRNYSEMPSTVSFVSIPMTAPLRYQGQPATDRRASGSHFFAPGSNPPAAVYVGGTGRAIAAHGGFILELPDQFNRFRIPRGTSITYWTGIGGSIPDEMGRLIEAGDYSAVISNPEYLRHMEGAVSYLPGTANVYNLSLTPPSGLNIMSRSRVVEQPTLLSDMVEPNMGHIDVAACRTIIMP